jgi:cytochrome c oxidase subunit 3
MYNGKFGLWLFLASEVMLFGGLFSAYVLLRFNADEGAWPTGVAAGLSTWIGMLNTMVLITSSVTMVMAWASLKMKQFNKARGYLAATLVLALAFLVVKLAFEYTPKWHHYGVWLKGQEGPVTGHIEDENDDEIVFHPDAPKDTHGASADAHAHAEAMHIKKADIVRLSNFGPKYSNYFGMYYTITGLHGLHILGGVLVIGYFLLTGGGMWRTEPERFTNRIECTGLYWHFVDLVWIFLFPTFYLL